MKLRILIKAFLYLIIALLISISSFSQVTDLKKIPLPQKNIQESASVSISENEWLLFYTNFEQDSLYSIRTTNSGSSWLQPIFLSTIRRSNNPFESIYLSAVKTNSNRILLAWNIYNDSVTVLRSDDNGYTWLNPIKILAGKDVFTTSQRMSLSKSNSGILFLVFSNSRSCWFRKSSDNGDSWGDSVYTIYSQANKFGSLIVFDELNMLAFINQPQNLVFSLRSSDGGNSWSNPVNIVEGEEDIIRPTAIAVESNSIWLVYQKKNVYLNKWNYPSSTLINNDIYYQISTDMGLSWQEEKQLTKYIGDDNFVTFSSYQGKPRILFSTTRFDNNYNLTYLLPGEIEEIKTPPYIVFCNTSQVDSLKNKIVLKAFVLDDTGVKSVNVNYGENLLVGELLDDGNHFDANPNDSLFANIFDLPRLDSYNNYVLEENNLKVPIDNKGLIAEGTSYSYNLLNGYLIGTDVENNSVQMDSPLRINFNTRYGRFEENIFLFSAGFVLSGLTSGSVWANGMAGAMLVEDYIPGPVGSDPKASQNSLYVVKSSDPPFGNSWITWKNAVELGAEFYDGDKDGYYNPIDKNFNGIWDPDEDLPLILGDETVWCVYNDGLPDSLRRWKSSVKNIEIASTFFSSKEPGLENVIFTRYKISNKSIADFDSVYFGFWADPDIGEFINDLAGCDTLYNSGFVYNYGPEDSVYAYGSNPPVMFRTILQGPIIETNSVFDTAFIKLGNFFGEKIFTGQKNIGMISHIQNYGGHPTLGVPNNALSARNYLMGKTSEGNTLDPCNNMVGVVLGQVNCNEINKSFWFSGDPVTQYGWLSIYPTDVRSMISTGPFTLKVNESVDLIGAFIVGRGTDHINSITAAREIVQETISEYNENFPRLTYKPGSPTNPVIDYELYQNYPNPFNPITKIRYAIPEDGLVTIKVYNILGQEVVTLKNEFQKANRYEVIFNSKGLASGVYIYRLQVNGFDQAMKMIILK